MDGNPEASFDRPFHHQQDRFPGRSGGNGAPSITSAFDGTGYPQKLMGSQILLPARIFALVDTFDAMTSDRPYRKALTYQDARNEISRCCGTQFDPEIVKCFLNIPEQVWIDIKAQVK